MRLTRRQAEYQALRAEVAEYKRYMRSPHSPSVLSDREDGAQISRVMAFEDKLRQHGYEPY